MAGIGQHLGRGEACGTRADNQRAGMRDKGGGLGQEKAPGRVPGERCQPMHGFTSLEEAGLEAICAARPDGASLRAALAGARVVDRENTGHGFYTHFAASPGTPDLPIRPEYGPLIWVEMEDLGTGMTLGFVLWASQGRPDCLEGFQNGDAGGRTEDLRGRDLDALLAARIVAEPRRR